MTEHLSNFNPYNGTLYCPICDEGLDAVYWNMDATTYWCHRCQGYVAEWDAEHGHDEYEPPQPPESDSRRWIDQLLEEE